MAFCFSFFRQCQFSVSKLADWRFVFGSHMPCLANRLGRANCYNYSCVSSLQEVQQQREREATLALAAGRKDQRQREVEAQACADTESIVVVKQ